MPERWTPRRLAAAAAIAWAGVGAAWYFGWAGWGHGGILRHAWEHFRGWRDGSPAQGRGGGDWPLIGVLPLMAAVFLSSAAVAGGWKRRKDPSA